MPAQYVKPYVKRGKNDAADVEAICEAVTRPTMRFVSIKSPEQQSAMMLHLVRLILNRQRTQLSNAMRAHLVEFGIVAPIGRNGIDQLLDVIADPADERVPADARFCLEMLAAQLRIVKKQILENDRRILASARETELGRRLMEILGVGPLLASAIVATVPDPAIFRSGRNLAAWIGLVPRQNSSGGKKRLGGITNAPSRSPPCPARTAQRPSGQHGREPRHDARSVHPRDIPRHRCSTRHSHAFAPQTGASVRRTSDAPVHNVCRAAPNADVSEVPELAGQSEPQHFQASRREQISTTAGLVGGHRVGRTGSRVRGGHGIRNVDVGSGNGKARGSWLRLRRLRIERRDFRRGLGSHDRSPCKGERAHLPGGFASARQPVSPSAARWHP